MVFAGGDPTLRRDLPDLLDHARGLGLLVEVQTNAHYMPQEMRSVLLGPLTDLIGLSLDGATAETHDAIRETRGNFQRVLNFLDSAQQVDKPVILRTVVTRKNRHEVANIASLIGRYSNIVRWSLLEFTPVGEGYTNADVFVVSRAEYLEAIALARSVYAGNASFDSFDAPSKLGTYALVTPEGKLYGTMTATDGHYPIVGDLIQDHLSQLASSLPFDATQHHARYGDALAPELEN
ncbi:hypothetical protein NicSoilB11_38300 [Arthrobacter sp. NicSoilB11]|nr:hypothetical protein NicSoilB11_38300 [Arthrobacter sp. NicSoilB11]